MASAHRFKSTPLKDPNDHDDGAVFRGPPGVGQERLKTLNFSAMEHMGFLSDYCVQLEFLMSPDV